MGPCVCSCNYIQKKDTKIVEASLNEHSNKIQKFSHRQKEESNDTQSLNNSLCIKVKKTKPILSHLKNKNKSKMNVLNNKELL